MVGVAAVVGFGGSSHALIFDDLVWRLSEGCMASDLQLSATSDRVWSFGSLVVWVTGLAMIDQIYPEIDEAEICGSVTVVLEGLANGGAGASHPIGHGVAGEP
ncbi:hypothetical protein FH972_019729 [Carpinus fangiana]|uniref:Uncharacterized protein n=1 Tax=Carpinus fangiana TaxID=176857 RepID=A0A5N6RVE3_9ROSI|nr:hypothetical protein FH972_019729 [Carpinus fangiana]